jgi:hypothetical protein
MSFELISYAYYGYVKNDKPMLRPAIVEANVQRPKKLRTVTELPFHTYSEAFDELVSLCFGGTRAAASRSARRAAPTRCSRPAGADR